MSRSNLRNKNLQAKYPLKTILPCIMLLGMYVFSTTLPAQAIYQGPAFGSISGGATVSTGQFENIPQTVEPQKRVHNLLWEKYDPLPDDDIYNPTPPSAPMGSNLYFDPAVSGLTQASDPPAVLIDFQGNSMTSSIPPDPIIAAGPDHIIAMVNTSFIIYDKQGNQLFQRSADIWFSNVAPYSGAFDPVIVYDHFAGRWVQVWDLQNDNNQTGYWLVSVSDDSDPMGDWCNFAFPAHLNGTFNSFTWGDYEKAGYDHQALYISGRQFGFGTGFFYCKLRIIPKSELYANNCGPVNYTDFWQFRDPANPSNVVDGPPIAAVHLDSPGNKAYIVVDADYNTSTFITLWTLDDPLGNPTLTAVNIPTAAAPWPNHGNQLGGGSPRIDVGRRAYRNAVYKNGQLWTSCPIGGGTGNAYTFARYVRLDVVNQTLLEDAALGANGFYYLYPAAMIDGNDNLFMVFSRSAATEYAGAAFTGRRENDPPGLAPSVMLKEGEGNYVVTFGGTRNRWGDYMGIALDPQYPNVVWGFIEYVASTNTWGNWVGAFAYDYYAIEGVVQDAVSGNPVEFANVSVSETGNKVVTDSTGIYALFLPVQDITINVSAFSYQPASLSLSLTLNDTLLQDIPLQPEVEAIFAGQVLDPSAGTGIEAEIEFYARGNPYPGPYLTTSTDPNGNYSVNTIIGTYDLVVKPVSPYAVTQIDSLVLGTGGLNYNIEILPADVLLVDDDRGSDYEQYYIASLEEIAITYHLWDTQTDGIPGAAQMAEFPSKAVVWYTGDTTAIPLSQAAQTELLSHLNNDGKLFLTGQDIAETIHGSGLLNELGVAYLQDNVQLVIRGTAGTIMNGLILVNSGTGGANNQVSRDQLDIINPATTQQIFQYGTAATNVAGVSYLNGEAKAVLLGFGWEGTGDSGKRTDLLNRVITYFDSTIVGIEDQVSNAQTPDEFQLAQNYPNPFNPITTIGFTIPRKTRVELTIYNTLGQNVRTLVNENMAAGTHKAAWDGKDDFGNPVTSGIYYYKFTAGDKFTDVKKLVFLK